MRRQQPSLKACKRLQDAERSLRSRRGAANRVVCLFLLHKIFTFAKALKLRTSINILKFSLSCGITLIKSHILLHEGRGWAGGGWWVLTGSSMGGADYGDGEVIGMQTTSVLASESDGWEGLGR